MESNNKYIESIPRKLFYVFL